MRINWTRAICAAFFFVELGNYFGWDHVADKSAEEVIATGIYFLLISLSVELEK
jgi:hypothetical protein